MSTLFETTPAGTLEPALSSNPAFSPAIGRWLLNGFAGLVLIFLSIGL